MLKKTARLVQRGIPNLVIELNERTQSRQPLSKEELSPELNFVTKSKEDVANEK